MEREALRLEDLASTAPFPDTALAWETVEATDREGRLAKGVEASKELGNMDALAEDLAKARAAAAARGRLLRAADDIGNDSAYYYSAE